MKHMLSQSGTVSTSEEYVCQPINQLNQYAVLQWWWLGGGGNFLQKQPMAELTSRLNPYSIATYKY